VAARGAVRGSLGGVINLSFLEPPRRVL